MKTLFWSLLAFALNVCSVSGSTYLYLIDTSASMRPSRTGMIEAVTKDLERAVATDAYKAGDQIYIWTFNSKITELKRYNFDPSSPQNIGIPVQSELKKVKLEGTTSIARPITKALADFGPTESGHLIVFLYTDGRDNVAKKDSEAIVRLARQYYNDSRLLRLHLVYFSPQELPKETRKLVTSLGGSMMVAEPSPQRTVTPPAPAPEKKEVKPEPVITVAPSAIHLLGQAAGAELIKPLPIEFTLPAGQTGLFVDLRFEATNWPSGMSISSATDRLATDGKQSIPLVIRNASPGRYKAVLKLSSSIRIEPQEIPIDLEILAPKPLEVGMRLYPENASRVDLPTDNVWHPLPNIGVTLFYPENLGDVRVRFNSDLPKSLELQVIPAKNIDKPIDAGAEVRLGDLGENATFRIRQVSGENAGKDLSARITPQLVAGQNVVLNGAKTLTVPLHFDLPLEVRVDTRELALGEIGPDTPSVKATVEFQVKGQPTSQQLRLMPRGSGLAGLSVTPNEISLRTGAMSVELEFAGFASKAPGLIEGTLAISPTEGAAAYFKETSIPVRAKIGEPSKLSGEAENPLVAGRPIVIHAHLKGAGKSTVQAIVRPPDAIREEQITLADSGLPEDGDVKADDGTYSGVFRKTEQLGRYQITLSANNARGKIGTLALMAPLYFKAPSAPLVGAITQRKKDDFVELKPAIVSEFPSDVPVSIETSTSRVPLETYLSNKTLKPGNDGIDLLVRLLPGAQAGEYKFDMFLVTEPISGIKARIPLRLDIKVTSFFQYFVRLVAVTLAVAVIVCLAVIRPWKRSAASEPDFPQHARRENFDVR